MYSSSTGKVTINHPTAAGRAGKDMGDTAESTVPEDAVQVSLSLSLSLSLRFKGLPFFLYCWVYYFMWSGALDLQL